MAGRSGEYEGCGREGRGSVGVDGGINALSTSKDSSQVVVDGRSGEYEGCGQGECRGMEASMLSAHQRIPHRLWWLVEVVSMRNVVRTRSIGVQRVSGCDKTPV